MGTDPPVSVGSSFETDKLQHFCPFQVPDMDQMYWTVCGIEETVSALDQSHMCNEGRHEKPESSF
jgi:hypothetical protein